MPLNRSAIGTVTVPVTIPVEVGQLRLFARAVGETDPVYTNEAAALSAGFTSLPAPPTFAFCLNLTAHAANHPFIEIAGMDMQRMLHAEQRFQNHRMIYAGDRITLTTTLSDIYDKKGGTLEFMVEDTCAVNQNGELCVDMQVVTVFRYA